MKKKSLRNLTTQLYLVRHGATNANDQVPYVLQGCSADFELNASGKQQAAALGRFLAEVPIHHVYASSMCRAVMTAQAVADFHNLPVQKRTELVECDVGNWEGMDWETIMQNHAEAHRKFTDDPAENPYLGGESYRDVLIRVRPVIHELLQAHVGETIVVVAHNIVNRVILADTFGLELRNAKKLRQSNGCLNIIRYRDNETTAMTINATFHLEEPWMIRAA